MENESLHDPSLDQLDFLELKDIALPNEMPTPKPQSYDGLSSVDTLLGQNEDLMARLRVSLRRIVELEEELDQIRSENNTFRHRNSSLGDQLMILEEKDKLTRSRWSDMLQQITLEKQKTTKLELLYKDIFVQAQALQKRIVKLERYRMRVHRAKKSVQNTASQVAPLREKIQDLNDQIENLTGRHAILIQSYEAKLNEAKIENKTLRERLQEREPLFQEKIDLENKLIHEQRQLTLTRDERSQDNERLTQEVARLSETLRQTRVELKKSLVEKESLAQEVSRLQGDIPQVQAHNEDLTEQVESLQALWGQKQRDLESVNEKHRSLQKLNQTISATLNQQRREISELKIQMEQQKMQDNERIRTLIAEIQQLRSSSTN